MAVSDLDNAVSQLASEVYTAGRVFLCGNGGSAANALHIANDLIAAGVRAHALTGDVATLTAIANDFGYEQIFARQLEVFASERDLLIVLSGSGNSANVLAALRAAKRIGMRSWAVIGAYGVAEAEALADGMIRAGRSMQAAEAQQLIIGHDLATFARGKA